MQIKKKIKYLILAAVLIYLIFPKPAFAQIPVTDLLVAGLLMGDETTEPLAQFLLYLFILYIAGLVFLYTSAFILEYVIEHPEWLSVTHNAMVQAGWQFTAGLANLFIVLALIVIAFGFILKIESWQSKKALPRLLIVALLVNFSLVFVGALIDIANILFNTILNAGGNDLPGQVIDSLGASGWVVVGTLIAWFGTLIAASFIPYAHVATIVISAILVPSVAIWVFQLILFSLVGGMFFLYAFVFAARVFIIRLLAILSPIFFLCWALPALKKYWEEWFGHLMEWLFFGVILFFFMVIGLKATSYLMPESKIPPTVPVLGWFSIEAYFPYYFFLFVYLAVVAGWVTMRVMPQIAKVLIEQGTKVGGQLLAMGVKPLGTILGKKIGQEIVKETARIEAKREETGKEPTWREKMVATPTGWALRVIGTSAKEEELKRTRKDAEEISRIEDNELAVAKIKRAMKGGDDVGAALMTAKRIDMGGKYRNAVLDEKNLPAKQRTMLARAANRVGQVEEAEAIARGTIGDIEEGKRETKLQEMGFKSYAHLTPDEQRLWDAKRYKDIADYLLGETDPNEVIHFKADFWKDDAIKERIARVMSPIQIALLANRFRQVFTEEYIKEYLKKTYPDLAAYRAVNKEQSDYLESDLGAPLGLSSPW